MRITINFQDDGDLYLEDASYSLGWLTVETGEIAVSFFKNKYCMIFLTLTTLLESLKMLSNNHTVMWTGEDNGSIIKVSIVKNEIYLRADDFSIGMPFEVFKTEIVKECHELINKCIKVNKDIVNESAFKDFRSVIDSFV